MFILPPATSVWVRSADSPLPSTMGPDGVLPSLR